MIKKKQLKYFDFWLIILMIVAVVIGIVAIGSATHVNATGDRYYVNKQIIGFISGFFIMLIVAFFPYEWLGKFYVLLYVANLAILLLVLFFGFGAEEVGANRWIAIGPFSIQPSEFSKMIMVLFLAKFIEKKGIEINRPLNLLFIIVLTAIPTYLIKEQPDLSTSIVLIALLAAMLFVSRLSYKYIVTFVSIIIPIGAFGIWTIYQPGQVVLKKILEPHQIERIMSFLEPEKYANSGAYQTLNSIQAIGSGQLSGKGLYQGTLNKFNYLPEPHTDFIFSVMGEEFGFTGCMLVITIMLLLIFKCIWNMRNTPDVFGKMICIGVATIFFFQTFVHIGVTTGLVPNTGMPLPFISYGLSSLWANMIGIGLVLNVSMMRNKNYY